MLQAIRDNQKVLVCAPSNIAVDTILSRLAADGTDRRYETSTNKVLSATSDIAVESGGDSSSGCARLEGKGMAKKKSAVARKPINMIRLGHPARLSERVLPYSLDYQIKIHEVKMQHVTAGIGFNLAIYRSLVVNLISCSTTVTSHLNY